MFIKLPRLLMKVLMVQVDFMIFDFNSIKKIVPRNMVAVGKSRSL